MRPIKNTACPKVNGVDKKYLDYKEWRRDLSDAYGQHCIYCNDRLPNTLQVEHLNPQSLKIINPLDWNNLYLACGPCNLAKSDSVLTTVSHYLPNINNTHLIFDFEIRRHRRLKGKIACIPVPKANLKQEQKAKASKTISDLKLDRVEQSPLRERKMTDVRWQNRFDTYELVKTQRNLWDTFTNQNQIDQYLLCIQPMLNKNGFFSLWANAFEDVPQVLAIIINSLPNLATCCFDPKNGYQPIPRNPGNIIDPI